jgi:hypothetical protein
MRSQGLTGEPATTVPDAVRSAGAVQAQATAPARLAIRPRSRGLDADAVNRACNEERSVVRTWAMRGTLHMVPSEDVGWMVGLLGPVFAAAGKRRRTQLGLDDDVLAGGLEAIHEVLGSEQPLRRADLVRKVADKGVDVELKGQAGPHLVSYAAMRGLVCRGPDLDDDEPTYVLLEDWVGAQPALEEDAALAELARRYVTAYGPATAQDFATWSGLKIGQARRGFASVAGEFDEVEVTGEPALTASADPEAAEPSVRLLPNFDAYLLGYRSRALALAPEFAERIHPGGGWIHAAVVIDGRVVGTWRRDQRTLTIEPFEPFERLDRAAQPGIETEAEDIGRFLSTDVNLSMRG